MEIHTKLHNTNMKTKSQQNNETKFRQKQGVGNVIKKKDAENNPKNNKQA